MQSAPLRRLRVPGGIAHHYCHYCLAEQPVTADPTLALSTEGQQKERLTTPPAAQFLLLPCGAARYCVYGCTGVLLLLLLRLPGGVVRRRCCFCWSERLLVKISFGLAPLTSHPLASLTLIIHPSCFGQRNGGSQCFNVTWLYPSSAGIF